MVLFVVFDGRIGIGVFADLLDLQAICVGDFRANRPGGPPGVQMVCRMLSCVISGLTAPGVRSGSG